MINYSNTNDNGCVPFCTKVWLDRCKKFYKYWRKHEMGTDPYCHDNEEEDEKYGKEYVVTLIYYDASEWSNENGGADAGIVTTRGNRGIYSTNQMNKLYKDEKQKFRNKFKVIENDKNV